MKVDHSRMMLPPSKVHEGSLDGLQSMKIIRIICSCFHRHQLTKHQMSKELLEELCPVLPVTLDFRCQEPEIVLAAHRGLTI